MTEKLETDHANLKRILVSDFPAKKAKSMREVPETELDIESTKQRLQHLKNSIERALDSQSGFSN